MDTDELQKRIFEKSDSQLKEIIKLLVNPAREAGARCSTDKVNPRRAVAQACNDLAHNLFIGMVDEHRQAALDNFMTAVDSGLPLDL